MYGYADWESQPQTYLSVGTLFLLKTFLFAPPFALAKVPRPQTNIKNVIVFSS